MTGAEFLTSIRHTPLRDTVETYGWSDEGLLISLNVALDELCQEIPLLLDRSTSAICEHIVGYDLANFAEGTNSGTIKIVNDINYYNSRSRYTLSAQDNVAMTSCTQQGTDTYCKYLISVTSAGAITITKGTEAVTLAGTSLPACPPGKTPIGVLLVQTTGVAFTSGTTDLSAAGVTSSFLTAPTFITLDSRIVKIISAKLSGQTKNLIIKDAQWFLEGYPDWENEDAGDSSLLVEGITTGQILLYPTPIYPDKLTLLVQRRQLTPFTTGNINNEIEILAEYQSKLVDYVAFRAFGEQDSNAYSPELETKHKLLWEENKIYIKSQHIAKSQRDEVIGPLFGMV